jgi:hypothetical protein
MQWAATNDLHYYFLAKLFLQMDQPVIVPVLSVIKIYFVHIFQCLGIFDQTPGCPLPTPTY